MADVHLVLGVAVVSLFLLAALLGAWGWWRWKPLPAFWTLLRGAQVALVTQVVLGGVLLAAGHEPDGDLHVLYGLLPLGVSFVAEQLRIASAEQVLEDRGFSSAHDVGALPAAEQHDVVLAIVRRETGVMTLAAIVCFGLVLRAAGTSGAF